METTHRLSLSAIFLLALFHVMFLGLGDLGGYVIALAAAGLTKTLLVPVLVTASLQIFAGVHLVAGFLIAAVAAVGLLLKRGELFSLGLIAALH